MKILNFGSLNIDYVYRVDRFVRAGETRAAASMQRNVGGKGLNQSVALARAGAQVFHAGCVGADGVFLLDFLRDEGVDTRYIRTVSAPTGHAVIEVEESGENRILLYGGANRLVCEEQVVETLSAFAAGDILLLQNEINGVERLIDAAHARGLTVVLNPSPFTENLAALPAGAVDWYFVNETEAAQLSGKSGEKAVIAALRQRFPCARFVYTMGSKGAVYFDAAAQLFVPAVPVEAVDTTAAGDTFTGYFIHALLQGEAIQQALKTAACASAITVSRPGAGRSIPAAEEVQAAMKEAR